jgi:hypothetical protein
VKIFLLARAAVAVIVGTNLVACVASRARHSECGNDRTFVIRPAKISCKNCEYYDNLDPWNNSEELRHMCCPEVSAAEIAASIPCVKPSDIFTPGCGPIGPGASQEQSFVDFKFFEVAAEHEVLIKHVGCSCGCKHLDCQYEDQKAFFVTNPEFPFRVGQGIDRETALAVVGLVESGRITGTESEPGWEDPRKALAGSMFRVERRNEDLFLRVDGCACSVDLRVRVEGEGAAAVLRILNTPEWGCV